MIRSLHPPGSRLPGQGLTGRLRLASTSRADRQCLPVKPRVIRCVNALRVPGSRSWEPGCRRGCSLPARAPGAEQGGRRIRLAGASGPGGAGDSRGDQRGWQRGPAGWGWQAGPAGSAVAPGALPRSSPGTPEPPTPLPAEGTWADSGFPGAGSRSRKRRRRRGGRGPRSAGPSGERRSTALVPSQRPLGSELATVPEEHRNEFGHLQPPLKEQLPKIPIRKADRGARAELRSGAERSRRLPELSRVLSLLLQELPGPAPRGERQGTGTLPCLVSAIVRQGRSRLDGLLLRIFVHSCSAWPLSRSGPKPLLCFLFL
ncbi:uncharacterized protein LOC113458802 [Zonotrichia albicollis]|uniref:uncharacterized protein LOC113458802 n=1 Tax=Zonotrichia albicollis TaxID=44394 RepID=UPI003D80C138